MNAPNYLDDDYYLAEFLAIAKQRFEEGDKAAILMAMHQCLLLKKPVPEWLRDGFLKAFESAAAFKIRSCDEAFGPPQEKGAHLEARKQYSELRYAVAVSVALRTPERAISKELFDDIGADLEISGTTASDVYYKHGGKELHEMIEPVVPALKARQARHFNSRKI
jgi:hypothetical protein